MIELTVGSRFYYKNELCEVVLDDNKSSPYLKCIFNNKKKCVKFKCIRTVRHDDNNVYFVYVK